MGKLGFKEASFKMFPFRTSSCDMKRKRVPKSGGIMAEGIVKKGFWDFWRSELTEEL